MEREIARDSFSSVGEPRQQLSCSKEPGNARVHADSQVRAAEVDTNRECSRIHTPAQWRSNQINCNHLEQFADFVRKVKAIPERMGRCSTISCSCMAAVNTDGKNQIHESLPLWLAASRCRPPLEYSLGIIPT